MDDSLHSPPMSIGCPIPGIRLFQTLILKRYGQGHRYGRRARSCSRPNILLIRVLFISHQSDQQFLGYRCFEIWPWNIQGHGHEWGQKSRSHIIPSIQLVLFFIVSHQSDQPFLKYGHNNVPHWRNTFENFKENFLNNRFKHNFSKIQSGHQHD